MTAALRCSDPPAPSRLPTDQASLTRLHRRLHAIAKSIVMRDDLADDAVQRVLIRLFRDEAGFDERKGSFETWTGFLTRRAAIDVLRGETRQRRNETFGHLVAAHVESPEQAVDRSLMRESATSMLDALPDDQRIVVEATYLGERTNSEIARELNLPLGTVKSRIRRGMKRVIDLAADGATVEHPWAT